MLKMCRNFFEMIGDNRFQLRSHEIFVSIFLFSFTENKILAFIVMNIHSSRLTRVRHCEHTCKFMQLRALKTLIMQSCRLETTSSVWNFWLRIADASLADRPKRR